MRPKSAFENIEHKNAFKKLLYCYISVFASLLLIVLIQIFYERYGNQSLQAWGWVILHTVPVTLLLLFIFFYGKNQFVLFSVNEQIVFKVVSSLSLFYLAALVSILLIQPFGNLEVPPAKRLHQTNTGLFIIQVLLSLLLLKFGKDKIYSRSPENNNQIPSYQGSSASTVFLSYNHLDRETADKLAVLLKKSGVDVVIDREEMRAGESIKTFIENSVLNTSVTLSLVSRNSLLSGWVCFETVNTFFLERFFPGKRFIAVYLDLSFLDIDFAVEAVRSIDARLEAIKKQIYEHDRLGIDSRNLNSDKTRLIALRNNMDVILDRLRNSLCLDVSDDKINETFPILLQSICNPKIPLDRYKS